MFPIFIYPIQISIQQNSQKFNKFLPHIKWDEVRKQPRCECLTFPCLIGRGTIAGSGVAVECLEISKRRDAFVCQTLTPTKLIKWN